MSRAGDVSVNPVTGERAVVRVGTEESGGAVVGEHVHPVIEEWFTVAGALGYRGSYPEYLERGPSERVEAGPLPASGANAIGRGC